MRTILGLSCYYHDSAATLVRDGVIVAAAQEERFTRKKNDSAFPKQAIDYCLREANLTASDIDLVVFYDKPFTKFERLVETYLATIPHGLRSYLEAMPSWINQKLFMRERIAKELGLPTEKILFAEHHESHAASAFYPSPFSEAAYLTIDGVGEWTTTSYGYGKGNALTALGELSFPHSIGLLYSAFTYYLGFKINDGEYKVMGLAPYGEPKYAHTILTELIDLKEDGSLKLNMTYFNFLTGLTMTNDRFHQLFGGQPRKPNEPVTQREMDLARSLQQVTEEAVFRMARHVQKTTNQKNLCMAGGVALNSVANGKLLASGIFEHIWIQPAAGDAGGSLGAALVGWHHVLNNPRTADGTHDAMRGAYLGPAFSTEEIRSYLDRNSIPYTEMPESEIAPTVAKLLANEHVVGWFQGRMEFGPRALGARSILGDARSPKMQSVLNLKIKFRESFRPFAPAILRERVSDFFELDADSPYMLFVVPVQERHRRAMTESEQKLFGIEKLNVARSDIPAVTHVDYSARVQTVHKDTNSRFYQLLEAFDRQTGFPVLINTSFNVNNEPIVCAPEEAYRCFMKTEMDMLVLDRFLLDKKAQRPL